MENCIFCKIVMGETPAFKVYEDDRYVAILDIFPLVEGQTLVMPKKHIGSYVFDAPDEEIAPLMSTARKVAKMLEKSLGAERVNLLFQGYHADHLHAKLYPKPVFMQLGERADDKTLLVLQKRIIGEIRD